MLISRGLPALRVAAKLPHHAMKLNQIRNSSHAPWNYRTISKPPAIMIRLAEITQGVAWWWILWHLFTEPEHIYGEWPYPDSRKWTDEELGIPSE